MRVELPFPRPTIDISRTGFWVSARVESDHAHDFTLADGLLDFLRRDGASSVVDLGCGMGKYVEHFRNNGLAATGFDGNPATPIITNYKCGVMDLSRVVSEPEVHDWTLSLEVGEHLPKEYEDAFLQNLHAHNRRGVILSWATKGQGGRGHFNEQDNEHVKEKMTSIGYVSDETAENELRRLCTLDWFKKTVMVFRRPS